MSKLKPELENKEREKELIWKEEGRKELAKELSIDTFNSVNEINTFDPEYYNELYVTWITKKLEAELK